MEGDDARAEYHDESKADGRDPRTNQAAQRPVWTVHLVDHALLHGFPQERESREGRVLYHDPSKVMFLIDPSLFTTRTGPVRVVTERIAIGETIMPAYDYQLDPPPWRGRPVVTTATDVNAARFLQTFETV